MMKNSSGRQSRYHRLQDVLRKHRILLAYLFGSQKDEGVEYLSGKKYKAASRSDLDIGLLLEKFPKDIFNLYGNLYSDLSEVFAPFSIDILFLNEVDPLLRYEIIKAKRIYARNEEFADNYEEHTIKIAADLALKRKMFENDFYEAIRNGYFEIELS